MYVFDKKKGHEPTNVVIPEYRLAFIIIPKCGNRSMKNMLVEGMGIGDKSQHLWGHTYAYLNQIPESYLKIAIVRNPFTRAVSVYNDKIRSNCKRKQIRKMGFTGKMSFEDFCKRLGRMPSDYDERMDVHLKSQHYFLTVNDELAVDIVVKQEELPASWQRASSAVFEHCGFGLPELPHLHKSSWKKFSYYYNELNDCARLVYLRYEKDFELLNYEKTI